MFGNLGQLTMNRENLDDFVSLVCVKSIITGMEDTLGKKAIAIALIAAGRTRGKNLTDSLGLSNSKISLEEVASKLNFALGNNGTKLCLVEKVEQINDSILVHAKETLFSSLEEKNSFRGCNYTLGVIWGALESIYDRRYQGSHVESVPSGGIQDVFSFKNLA